MRPRCQPRTSSSMECASSLEPINPSWVCFARTFSIRSVKKRLKNVKISCPSRRHLLLLLKNLIASSWRTHPHFPGLSRSQERNFGAPPTSRSRNIGKPPQDSLTLRSQLGVKLIDALKWAVRLLHHVGSLRRWLTPRSTAKIVSLFLSPLLSLSLSLSLQRYTVPVFHPLAVRVLASLAFIDSPTSARPQLRLSKAQWHSSPLWGSDLKSVPPPHSAHWKRALTDHCSWILAFVVPGWGLPYSIKTQPLWVETRTIEKRATFCQSTSMVNEDSNPPFPFSLAPLSLSLSLFYFLFAFLRFSFFYLSIMFHAMIRERKWLLQWIQN